MASKKLPAMQWYPGDWRKDPGVQSLGLAERGAWWEILQLMWESPQRGLLLLPSGHPMPPEALARILGESKQNMKQIVSTLEAHGVADRDPDSGALRNRRMYREDVERQRKAAAGRKGGKKSRPPSAGSKTEAEAKQEGKQNGTSSVSSSVSPSVTDNPSTSDEVSPLGSKTEAEAEAAGGAFAERFPDLNGAAEVLDGMKHPGGESATTATLRTSFLYGDPSDAIPDASVKGKSVEERHKLVSRALLEMRDQGEADRWSAPNLAGYIRRLNTRDERGDHDRTRNRTTGSGKKEPPGLKPNPIRGDPSRRRRGPA